jgi:hypothetical protein
MMGDADSMGEDTEGCEGGGVRGENKQSSLFMIAT